MSGVNAQDLGDTGCTVVCPNNLKKDYEIIVKSSNNTTATTQPTASCGVSTQPATSCGVNTQQIATCGVSTPPATCSLPQSENYSIEKYVGKYTSDSAMSINFHCPLLMDDLRVG